MTVTTHVLDTALGLPAQGMSVRLRAGEVVLADATTDADGRVSSLAPGVLAPGRYELIFGTDAYFAATGRRTLFPEIVVAFELHDEPHLHVPLLLAPFAYSTYRGS